MCLVPVHRRIAPPNFPIQFRRFPQEKRIAFQSFPVLRLLRNVLAVIVPTAVVLCFQAAPVWFFPLCSPYFLPIRPLARFPASSITLSLSSTARYICTTSMFTFCKENFMWALRFSLAYDILQMNPDLVPANRTLIFPEPWNQSVVLFMFSDKYSTD